MENIWILFVLLYALMKGSRDGMKKAALRKNGANEILFFYTLFGLILILPFSGSAFSLSPVYIFFAFIKAGVVGLSWVFSFTALKKMSVGLFGIVDLSRILFATMLGVVVLGEGLTLAKVAGLSLVLFGLILVNRKTEGKRETTLLMLLFALLSCFLNAVSELMDKILMQHMDAGQLQFWFMFFMTVMYGVGLLVRRERISLKTMKTNYWIPLMTLSLVVGDRLLFEANANPASEMTVMTAIKQSAVLVTVLSGHWFFGEKKLGYKLFCTGIILSGIFIVAYL